MNLKEKGIRTSLGVITVLLVLVSLFVPASAAAALNPRTTLDQPDDVAGYQVHFVYVVPSDAQDKLLDTNGEITTWLNQAQDWLQRLIGHKIIIDTFQHEYDISYMKSKSNTKELIYENSTLQSLATEFSELGLKSSNPKTYIFIFSETLDPKVCGWASRSSDLGLVTANGQGCWNGPQDDQAAPYGVPYIVSAIVHEYFHTLGVKHTCVDGTDVMLGSPECSQERSRFAMTFDLPRTNYIGGDKSGVDILKLPIWTDNSGSVSSATLTPNIQYGQKLSVSKTPYAIVGQSTGDVGWSWTPAVSASALSLITCTLEIDTYSVTKDATSGSCNFDIPNNLRVGHAFKITSSQKIGPYQGVASINGILVRADFSKETCTVDFCFPNENYSFQRWCYQSPLSGYMLQELVNGKWIDLQVVPIEPDASQTCPQGYPYKTALIQKTITEVGDHVFRYAYRPGLAVDQTSRTPFSVTIVEPNSVEPSVAEIAQSNSKAVDLGSKADAAAEAERLAAAKAEEERQSKILAEAERLAAIQRAEERAAAAKAAKLKKSTITCVKGSNVKKVTSVKPKCPTGYRKK